MNHPKVISFFCTVTFFFFAANCLAKSNDFNVKPAVPSSKVKITAPSPAPPVLVAPTKTKAPVSKPAPPKVSVKQPKPSTPKVSVKKPRLSAPKPVTAPASLPPSIGQRGLPQAHIPKDLGQAVHIRRDLSKTNSIRGRMPAGHTTPVAGSGAIGGTDGHVKVISQRTGADSAMYDPSDSTGLRFVQGAGEHIQGQETGEQQNQKQPDEITFTEEESKADYDAWMKELEKEWDAPETQKELDRVDTHTADVNDEAEDEGPQPPGETTSERTAEDGPGDGSHTGKGVNQKKLQAIFSGSPGIRLAPGEEGGGGGDLNPGQISEIISNQTQVHTFEGGVPESTNFEDLGKQVQKVIEDGGYSEVQINPGKP